MRVDRRHSREGKTISVLHLIVGERQQPDLVLAVILFETRVVAHRLDQVAAVRLNELDDIDPRQPQINKAQEPEPPPDSDRFTMHELEVIVSRRAAHGFDAWRIG